MAGLGEESGEGVGEELGVGEGEGDVGTVGFAVPALGELSTKLPIPSGERDQLRSF